MKFKRTHLAIAVAALVATPTAFAADMVWEEYSAYVNNTVDSTTTRNGSSTTTSSVLLDQTLSATAASIATLDDKQYNRDNLTTNDTVTNDASLTNSALRDASGVIGVNVAAGDSHLQDNAVSISALEDAEMVFANAEILINQAGVANIVSSIDSVNDATLDGNALQNASGIIGVNVTSGVGNMQKNDAAAALASDQVLAQSTVVNIQSEELNTVDNTFVDNTATVAYTMQNASGVIGVNVAAGNNNVQSNSLSLAVAGLN